jgi:hypothetical protein
VAPAGKRWWAALPKKPGLSFPGKTGVFLPRGPRFKPEKAGLDLPGRKPAAALSGRGLPAGKGLFFMPRPCAIIRDVEKYEEAEEKDARRGLL